MTKEEKFLEIDWNDPEETVPRCYVPVAVMVERTEYDKSKGCYVYMGIYNGEGEWVASNYNTPNVKINEKVVGWLPFRNDIPHISSALIRVMHAYDNVDLEKLTDKELEEFGSMCNNGYGDYLREKRNRKSDGTRT